MPGWRLRRTTICWENIPLNYKKTHSQTLLPMLDEVAKMTELDLSTVDAIAVSAGPGSFTGLRTGSATRERGLGLAAKAPPHIPVHSRV